MSITIAGRAFREKHLSQDTCTIRRETGTVFDPATGQNVPTYTTLYSGVGCHVRAQAGREVNAGEQALQLHLYHVIVPHTVIDVRPEDIVDVASADGDLDGASLVVDDTEAGSFAHRRTLVCRLNLE